MDSAVEEKLKEKYLKLLGKGLHKKEAAFELGVDLVMVRSWRMKDQDFNKLCKNFTVGKEDKSKVELKEPFIELLEQGVSQREAARQLDISLAVIRTWKRTDKPFKKRALAARFGIDDDDFDEE